ncbi:MAG: hypothetical protein JST68_29360 [Bacteroidetes bacterium]|nr:hypothetical protein [Bacteroidota bacterium]
MRIFSAQEIADVILNESLITMINWTNRLEDLMLGIDWCGQEDFKENIDFNNVKSSLHFEFVTDLVVDFKFRERTMGALEIASFKYEYKESIWLIEFEFKFIPVGFIKFKCNDFRFIIEDIR